MSAKARRDAGVPLWVVDDLEEVEEAVRNLAEAVECMGEAARTESTDPTEFIGGALAVLLLAVQDAREKAVRLRREAERRIA